jgi:hypothetical protein
MSKNDIQTLANEVHIDETVDRFLREFNLPVPEALIPMIAIDVEESDNYPQHSLFNEQGEIDPNINPTLFMLQQVYEEVGIKDNFKLVAVKAVSKKANEIYTLHAIEGIPTFLGKCAELGVKYSKIMTKSTDELANKIRIALDRLKEIDRYAKMIPLRAPTSIPTPA